VIINTYEKRSEKLYYFVGKRIKDRNVVLTIIIEYIEYLYTRFSMLYYDTKFAGFMTKEFTN
jgi:hypothetical protein